MRGGWEVKRGIFYLCNYGLMGLLRGGKGGHIGFLGSKNPLWGRSRNPSNMFGFLIFNSVSS